LGLSIGLKLGREIVVAEILLIRREPPFEGTGKGGAEGALDFGRDGGEADELGCFATHLENAVEVPWSSSSLGSSGAFCCVY
jgi:hypothetical protein